MLNKLMYNKGELKMKNYQEGRLNKLQLQPYNIVVAQTSVPDYEMSRKILLERLDGLHYGEYVLLEGGHCSCYDFDETEWDATVYEREELIKLANADYNQNDKFWQLVKVAMG
jgi:hypothetical protein